MAVSMKKGGDKIGGGPVLPPISGVAARSKSSSAGSVSASAAATPAATEKTSAKVLTMPFRGNVTEVIHHMRNGVSAELVPVIARQFGMTQDGLFEQLRLPKSTMKSRISKNGLLSSAEQDRMYRADKVWKRALSVLEDESAARQWIRGVNRALGGETPLSLLDTEAGYELVLDTLGRIEYGVVS